MSRFKKGDTVWSGRGVHQREMVVALVRENKFVPIRQYGFEAPYDGFLCGEQSIRSERNGRDLKLSECFIEDFKEAEISINTLASATFKTIEEDTGDIRFPRMSTFDSTRVDFKPSLGFCEWLTEYADGKLIIHVGSGQGHLVRMLKMCKARVCGIEPNFNKTEWIKWRMARELEWSSSINEILEGDVQRYKKLINDLGADKAILVIARPKVNDFVRTTIKQMPRGMELVYIDVEANAKQNSSLGIWAMYAKDLPHQGVTEDSEKVYSIIKEE